MCRQSLPTWQTCNVPLAFRVPDRASKVLPHLLLLGAKTQQVYGGIVESQLLLD